MQPQPRSAGATGSSHQIHAAQWQGPLPPPGALKHFDDIIPGGADRIMSMVEREQAHRIQHEQNELSATVNDFRRGHILGGLLGTLSIFGAVYTAYFGAAPAVSIALVGLPVAAIIRSVLIRR